MVERKKEEMKKEKDPIQKKCNHSMPKVISQAVSSVGGINTFEDFPVFMNTDVLHLFICLLRLWLNLQGHHYCTQIVIFVFFSSHFTQLPTGNGQCCISLSNFSFLTFISYNLTIKYDIPQVVFPVLFPPFSYLSSPMSSSEHEELHTNNAEPRRADP